MNKPDEISNSKVAIIIVNWNGKTDTLACLHSLRHLRYPDFDVIVVDNGSTDGSVESFRAECDWVKILETGQNLGYAGGNNAGLTYALEKDYDYFLLLNNDTEVDPDFLGYLVQALEEDSELGVVGPLIYYFSLPEILWSAGGMIDRKKINTYMKGIDEKDVGQFGTEIFPVDFVTGCAFLINRNTIEKTGLLDERFFMYYEEVEWSCRIYQAGFKITVVPQAKLWHKILPNERGETAFGTYLAFRNRLLFIKASGYGNFTLLRVLLLDYLRTIVSWSVKPKWRDKRKLRKVIFKAAADFFRGKFGKPDMIW